MKSHGRRYMKRRKQIRLQWRDRGPGCWVVEVSMHNVSVKMSERILDTVADTVYTRFQDTDIYVGVDATCNLDGECRDQS